MQGGDLAWLWKPYAFYGTVDKVYGWDAFNNKDGFTGAQAAMNVPETALNFVYLYLGSNSPVGPLVGFTAASLTFAKTALYWLREYFCDYCDVGHNGLYNLVVVWMIPNGAWLVVPAYIMYILGSDLIASLRLAHRIQADTGKTTAKSR